MLAIFRNDKIRADLHVALRLDYPLDKASLLKLIVTSDSLSDLVSSTSLVRTPDGLLLRSRVSLGETSPACGTCLMGRK